MTLDEILASLFPAGHDAVIARDLMTGQGRLAGGMSSTY